MEKQASKEIKLLSEFEYVRLRPEIYIGSPNLTSEIIPIITDNLQFQNRNISIGMYKLYSEILDNAIDEIKRVRRKSKRDLFIKIVFDEKNNRITVQDNGDGFHEPTNINPKSKMTNIETAFCFLKAGSNFDNSNVSASIIGTNGLGGALVNMLSKEFNVTSTNKHSMFTQTWKEFKANKKPIVEEGSFKNTGTTVSFIPTNEVFFDFKYELDLLYSLTLLKKKSLLLNNDLNNVNLKFYKIGIMGDENVELDVESVKFEQSYQIVSDDMEIVIGCKNEFNQSLLYVNSTQCMGSPIMIIEDFLNDKIFKNPKAKLYYNVICMINLPPDLVKFGDQIKTKYSIPRNKIEDIIIDVLKKHINKFLSSDLFSIIMESIDSNENSKIKSKILKDKKKKSDFSKKHLPASKRKFLFLVEGESAMGSIGRARNPELHGIYALKGKIKNCSRLSDLKNDAEIIEIINVLDLEFDSDKTTYENIVIATDADPDGYHISSLIINFFYKWFPKIIESGKLFILKTPLMSYEINKKINYIYKLSELNSIDQSKISNKRYLKGLGALSDNDWANIFSSTPLIKIVADEDAKRYLNMAFDESSDVRKLWLNNLNF